MWCQDEKQTLTTQFRDALKEKVRAQFLIVSECVAKGSCFLGRGSGSGAGFAGRCVSGRSNRPSPCRKEVIENVTF